MARPKKDIDYGLLSKLLEVQCTEREIAHIFEISIDTLDRRIKEKYNIGFAEYKAQKESWGKSLLRRKQVDLALKGNVPMLIFLGKNLLDQKDKHDTNTQVNHTVTANNEEREKLQRMPLKDLVNYIQENLPVEKN